MVELPEPAGERSWPVPASGSGQSHWGWRCEQYRYPDVPPGVTPGDARQSPPGRSVPVMKPPPRLHEVESGTKLLGQTCRQFRMPAGGSARELESEPAVSPSVEIERGQISRPGAVPAVGKHLEHQVGRPEVGAEVDLARLVPEIADGHRRAGARSLWVVARSFNTAQWRRLVQFQRVPAGAEYSLFVLPRIPR
jgi:hypothetical protein